MHAELKGLFIVFSSKLAVIPLCEHLRILLAGCLCIQTHHIMPQTHGFMMCWDQSSCWFSPRKDSFAVSDPLSEYLPCPICQFIHWPLFSLSSFKQEQPAEVAQPANAAAGYMRTRWGDTTSIRAEESHPLSPSVAHSIMAHLKATWHYMIQGSDHLVLGNRRLMGLSCCCSWQCHSCQGLQLKLLMTIALVWFRGLLELTCYVKSFFALHQNHSRTGSKYFEDGSKQF